jgi:hypothetical protein
MVRDENKRHSNAFPINLSKKSCRDVRSASCHSTANQKKTHFARLYEQATNQTDFCKNSIGNVDRIRICNHPMRH